jgi:hypothetical protein
MSSTPLTFVPLRGEMCDAPCTSAIVVGGTAVLSAAAGTTPGREWLPLYSRRVRRTWPG